ncbi:ATP-dependent RNA helicase DHX36 [Lecanosticta acicola]|uniref:RNA helicase n=1 Tax=Lecanosticta acicola TaxID=111012 RepID=A0AAI8YSG5_9PEZI|nr:ATP-dependent RNA helicase DHX36 [Lecanosticta acicola]
MAVATSRQICLRACKPPQSVNAYHGPRYASGLPRWYATTAQDERQPDPANIRWSEIRKRASSALDTHSEVSVKRKDHLLGKLSICAPTEASSRRIWYGELVKALESENPIKGIEDFATPAFKTLDCPDLPLTSAPSNKAEAASILESATLEFIRRHKELPTPKDYPESNWELWDGNYPRKILEELCQQAKAQLRVSCVYKSRKELLDVYKQAMGADQWACFAQVSIGQLRTERSAGVGSGKDSAGMAALTNALSRLHTSGALKQLLGQKESKQNSRAQGGNKPHREQLPLSDDKKEGGHQERLSTSGSAPGFPTREQYPSAPETLFDAKNISETLHSTCAKLQEPCRQEIKFQTFKFGKREYTSCRLTLDILKTRTNAKGKGPSKVAAKRDAWVHMLPILHTNGVLRQLYSDHGDPRNQTNTVQSRTAEEEIQLVNVAAHTLREEKDAKIEIYNYAASLGLIPDCSFRTVNPRSRRLKRALGKAKLPVEVAIKVPELNIDVVKVGKDMATAEVAAAIAFKREAEEQQKLAGDAPVQSHLEGSDHGLFSVESAPEFFELYRSRNRGCQISVENEPVNIGSQTFHKAQIVLDGDSIGEAVTMKSKKTAEAVAYLTAAVDIARQSPEMLQAFTEAMQKGNGKVIRDAPMVEVNVKSAVLELMRETLTAARRAGLSDAKGTLTAEKIHDDSSNRRRNNRELSDKQRDLASGKHTRCLREFESDPALHEKRAARDSLPMAQHSSEVLQLTSDCVYGIVIGATGSGKTTQVPQIILDDAISRGKGGYCDVICTQPRRLAATSVAQRVAAERNEPLGRTVGYHVRHDSRLPSPGGSITYCTTGILLEQLKHDPNGIMDSVSHLVIDEVHERDLQIDFLMIIIKKAIKARQEASKPVPKVILMSATLDAKLFSGYLGSTGKDGQLVPCPVVSVPGRTFPVEESYLGDLLPRMRASYAHDFTALIEADAASKDFVYAELAFAESTSGTPRDSSIDWKRTYKQAVADDSPTAAEEKSEALVPVNLIGAMIAHICKSSADGAILAFLPGLQELTATRELLIQPKGVLGVNFADDTKFKICLLHSNVPPEEQQIALKPMPPGCRKIILSTNIAETSVTVPDVKFVVDSGKLRENRYDHTRGITKLQCTWESNSNARQRAGRAGRVQAGNYYAAFSRERRQAMPASGLPELLRSDLQETCLAIKAQRFEEPVSEFLSQAIEAPPRTAVDNAVEKLKALEALTENEELTMLGRVLSRLPVHPSLGKMIILGIIFRCLEPMLVLAAMSDERSFFATPPGSKEIVRKIRNSYGKTDSDQLTSLAAFDDLRRYRDQNSPVAAMRYAHAKYLHMGAFRSIASTARQIEEILLDAGLIAPFPRTRSASQLGGGALNRNSKNEALIKSLLLAGLHPNLGVQPAGKHRGCRTRTERGIAPPGKFQDRLRPVSRDGEAQLFTYNVLAKAATGDSLFMRESTRVTPLMALLFGGKLETSNWSRLVMDEWLPFKIRCLDWKYGTQLTLEFKKALGRMLNGAFQDLSEVRDGQSLADDPVREKFVSGLVELLREDQE